MAVEELPALQILTALTQVMQGQLGTVHRMSPGIFSSASFISFGNDAEKKKQVAAAVLKAGARNAFEIEATPVGDNLASSYRATSSKVIVDLAILFRVLKATGQSACSCEVAFGKPQNIAMIAERIAAQARLMSDLEKAVEALTGPGNMRVTQAGEATGIVDLMIGPAGDGSPLYSIDRPIDWDSMFIEARIAGRLIVEIEQAT